jgi:ribokinase
MIRFDAITIGTAVRDVFLKSELFKVVRDPEHLKKMGFPSGEAQCFALGGKIDVENPPISAMGGGAANAAVTFARQGLKTAAIAGLGADRDGDAIIEDLRAEGVTLHASRSKKNGTGYSTLLLSPSGERTILTYRGAANDLRLAEIRLNKFRPRWAYIVPSAIPLSVVLAIAKHCKNVGTRIAIDPSHYYLEMGANKLAPLLKIMDVVKMNREEAALLTGENYKDEKAIFKAFDKIVPGIAVLTDGPRGVVVSDGKKIYRAGIFKEKMVADRTGAGDAFGSGFVAALAAGKDIEYAIRLGSANATSVVEHIGAHTGALKKGDFRKESRWRSLRVSVSAIK